MTINLPPTVEVTGVSGGGTPLGSPGGAAAGGAGGGPGSGAADALPGRASPKKCSGTIGSSAADSAGEVTEMSTGGEKMRSANVLQRPSTAKERRAM